MSDMFRDRDIISITDFSREEILSLCAAGRRMEELEKTGRRNSLRDALKHRTLSYMFYEPSTRTRTSFNTGMRELGGRYDGFSGTEGTSVMKNETVRDTVTMMCANHNDVLVMRHPLDGSLQWAADVANIPVINGGDGRNEHPTQALLDVLTVYSLREGRLDGLRMGFGGDLSHGRTVRSLSLALSHFDNVSIHWAAEDFLGHASRPGGAPVRPRGDGGEGRHGPRRDAPGGFLLHDAAAAGADARREAERHHRDDEAVPHRPAEDRGLRRARAPPAAREQRDRRDRLPRLLHPGPGLLHAGRARDLPPQGAPARDAGPRRLPPLRRAAAARAGDRQQQAGPRPAGARARAGCSSTRSRTAP